MTWARVRAGNRSIRRRKQGSGVGIGGDNTGAVQNVVGQNISNVHRHAAPHTTTESAAVRELLATFPA
ncbi:hypothetical protein ABZT43_49570 [Streptomyces sp. NPDC005349]|uniref:hypothetical protein n=1 Tax=Streptomyces sp. NPDC005349 TaxID=3157037 RepID=UPI0033AEF873